MDQHSFQTSDDSDDHDSSDEGSEVIAPAQTKAARTAPRRATAASPPATAAAPAAPAAPPAPSPDAGLLEMFLASSPGDIGRLFDVLVTEQFGTDNEAAQRAHIRMQESDFKANQASAALHSAERAFLADASDEAHQRVQQAKGDLEKARSYVGLARRDHEAKLADITARKKGLARRLYDEAARQINHNNVLSTPDAVASIERLGVLCQAVAREVSVLHKTLVRQHYIVRTFIYPLAALAGVDPATVRAPEMYVGEMRLRVREMLMKAGLEAGIHPDLGAWLPNDVHFVVPPFTKPLSQSARRRLGWRDQLERPDLAGASFGDGLPGDVEREGDRAAREVDGVAHVDRRVDAADDPAHP
ncbi:MAG: hypothetical protein EOO70_06825 [Myxococcaceae bacterium]|nr:MAG: hypothetical protein EOO70_06825 [Myxococcaceae bacterium]